MTQIKIDFHAANRRAAANAAYRYSAKGYNRVAHHWSYRPEHHTDLIYLNKSQHGLAHSSMYYDQDQMVFRSIFTDELLDTKEKHLKHIQPYIKGNKVAVVKMRPEGSVTDARFCSMMRQVRRNALASGATVNAYLLTLIETHPDRSKARK